MLLQILQTLKQSKQQSIISSMNNLMPLNVTPKDFPSSPVVKNLLINADII